MPPHKQPPTPPIIIQRARELRRPQTPAEQHLWARLRNSQLAGHKFRRQHPMGRFIVDFLCAAEGLIIEVDGDTHVAQAAYDAARTEWLMAQGYRVLRFTNHDVLQQVDGVLTTILQACLREESAEP